MITFDYRVPEQEKFVIDSDKKAEWALRKIKEKKADMDRYVSVCDEMIAEYEQKKKAAQERYEQETSYFKTQLAQYFETVDKRKTKTQEIYELPGGTLRRKYPKPALKRDDKQLIEWLKTNSMNSYIETEEKINWRCLKRSIYVKDNIVVTEDGEIVEGVEVIERPPTFEVEVEE